VELTHSFTVPVDRATAWAAFEDISSVAECFPGAVVTSVEGDTFQGTCKVKLGPVALQYAGSGTFVERDEAAGRLVLDAKGRDKRGNGTAGAHVTATFEEESPSSTRVQVVTDLQITGKPAQFGRGVMVEVGNKLLGKFADCLADELSGGSAPATDAPAAAASGAPAAPAASDAPAGGQTAAAASDIASSTSAAAPQATTPPPSLRRLPDDDAIDLLDTAGPAVLKRLAPVLAGLVLLLLLWRLRSRRRD
jgi:carbon monoxide dehydrogenase subunit G